MFHLYSSYMALLLPRSKHNMYWYGCEKELWAMDNHMNREKKKSLSIRGFLSFLTFSVVS